MPYRQQDPQLRCTIVCGCDFEFIVLFFLPVLHSLGSSSLLHFLLLFFTSAINTIYASELRLVIDDGTCSFRSVRRLTFERVVNHGISRFKRGESDVLLGRLIRFTFFPNGNIPNDLGGRTIGRAFASLDQANKSIPRFRRFARSS